MNPVSTTAEGGNTLVNVGEVMTQFANSAIQGISDSIVALIPVITLTTVIGIAIRMFKNVRKGVSLTATRAVHSVNCPFIMPIFKGEL